MPSDILIHITSFLTFKQSLHLEKLSRFFYIATNKTNGVKNINIPKIGQLNLSKYRSVTVMTLPMCAIKKCHGRCHSQRLSKVTLLGPSNQSEIDDAFNPNNSIIILNNVESFIVKDFRLKYDASKLQFSGVFKQMPSLKELQVIRSEIEIDFTEIKNCNLTGLSIDQYDKNEAIHIINIIKISQLQYLWIKDRATFAKDIEEIGSCLSKLKYLGISSITGNTLKCLAQSSLSDSVISLQKPRSINLSQLKAYISDISKKVRCLKLIDFENLQLKYTLQGFCDAIKSTKPSKIQLIIQKQSTSSVMKCLNEIKSIFNALLNHCSHFQMNFVLIISDIDEIDRLKHYLSRLPKDQLITEAVFIEHDSKKYNVIKFPWSFRD